MDLTRLYRCSRGSLAPWDLGHTVSMRRGQWVLEKHGAHRIKLRSGRAGSACLFWNRATAVTSGLLRGTYDGGRDGKRAFDVLGPLRLRRPPEVHEPSREGVRHRVVREHPWTALNVFSTNSIRRLVSYAEPNMACLREGPGDDRLPEGVAGGVHGTLERARRRKNGI